MEIWIAIFHDIESDRILGVFASKDLAEAAKFQHGNYAQYPGGTNERSEAIAWDDADVERWEVQG